MMRKCLLLSLSFATCAFGVEDEHAHTIPLLPSSLTGAKNDIGASPVVKNIDHFIEAYIHAFFKYIFNNISLAPNCSELTPSLLFEELEQSGELNVESIRVLHKYYPEFDAEYKRLFHELGSAEQAWQAFEVYFEQYGLAEVIAIYQQNPQARSALFEHFLQVNGEDFFGSIFESLAALNDPRVRPSLVFKALEKEGYLGDELPSVLCEHYPMFDLLFARKLQELKDVPAAWRWFSDYFISGLKPAMVS